MNLLEIEQILMKKHKKLEFFQRIVLLSFGISFGIVLLTLTANFILLWNDHEPMTQETVAAITTYGGIKSSITASAYATLQSIRGWSLNKHKNGKLSD